MATVHRDTTTDKAEEMSPAAVMAHVVELSRKLARQDGAPCAVHAVAAYRVAYQRLWDRLATLEEMVITGDFWPEEGGRS